MTSRTASIVFAVLFVHFVLLASPTKAAPTGELAYIRLTNGYWQVWICNLDTGDHRQVTFSEFDKRTPAWASSERLLLRSNNDHLYEVSTIGGKEKPFAKDHWPMVDPSWSPGHETLAVARIRTDVIDASSLWLLDAQGVVLEVLQQGTGLRVQPTWSPDGKRIAYARTHGPSRSSIKTVTMRVGQPASAGEELVGGAYHNQHPAWSPDGARIAFDSNRSGEYEIWTLNLESGDFKRLTRHVGLDTGAAWSPDGTQLAWASFREGGFEIWVMAADGTDSRQLFDVGAEVRDPAWR